MKIKDSFLEKILNKIILHNATPILVGGCVRDDFLELDVKDYDIEVYGLGTLEDLENILEEFGSVNLVGKSFGIVKLTTQDMEYDFSFPRTENKISQGHTGFEVLVDGSLEFKEAAKRRDFTINAIGYDYQNKIYLDPFDGIIDIQNKLLKHIDENTFQEDPLRVYRAIQFSARFEFVLDVSTFDLCCKIIQNKEFGLLSKERIYEEYKKLFLKSSKPSIGLNLLNDLGVEKIDVLSIGFVDEIVKKDLDESESLLLIFSILHTLFLKISNDKKFLKKINTFINFQVPPIFEKKQHKNDSFIEQLLIKLQTQKSMPKPLFMGKDLIQMGYKPSEKFKTILDTLYKMQLSGKIC